MDRDGEVPGADAGPDYEGARRSRDGGRGPRRDAGPAPVDAGTNGGGTVDAGSVLADAGSVLADAGAPSPDAGAPSPDAGSPGSPDAGGATGECAAARRLWFDDFETGDYRRWTSMSYGDGWGNGCQSNGITTERANTGSRSQRSEITCTYPESHRGYGGVQFSGDSFVPAYTNTGTGIDAPYGVVNTFYSWVEAGYDFGSGKWLSLWTVNSDCGWGEQVITMGFEDPSGRLTPAHILSTGGTVTYEPGAPAFPRGEWVRTTIYVNLYEGRIHVWQNGRSLLRATVSRPTRDLCQWHWGAYASGNNDDVVRYEDDNSIWKLDAPWTDFSREPWLGESVPVCR